MRRILITALAVMLGAMGVASPRLADAGNPPLARVISVSPARGEPALVLRIGNSGPEVKMLQATLRSYGYTLAVDGVFGMQTQRVLIAWQRANALEMDGIFGPATAKTFEGADNYARAARSTPPSSAPVGLQGRPFASGLDGCDEMNFYRVQWDLPERFASLGWRESNCRNDVRTWCCFGYWQNFISSHLSAQSAYRGRIRDECQVFSAADIFGLDPLQKQKQACVTAVVFQISGFSPWS